MQTEMDNNDNLVIKGLEALLGGEDSTDFSQNKSFEDMRTKFKDSFSLDQSKDSGVAFANLSYRHLPSVNTSIQNVNNLLIIFRAINFNVHIISAINGIWILL